MGVRARQGEAVTALILACGVASACGTSEQRVIFDPEPVGEVPPTLAIPEADAATDAEAGKVDVAMCPSDKCRAPWGTCATSKYLCDIDFANDPENCGSCGNKCPTDSWRASELHATWKCVNGACQMACSTYLWGECNGHIEDGCETPLRTNDNCAACGDTCAEGSLCVTDTCVGCAPNETLCGTVCADLVSNDANCGACGTVCPRFPAGYPAAPKSMYYGCANSVCNNLKCLMGYANCNGELNDGCEVDLSKDPKNCGGCGIECAAGEACLKGVCQCNPGPSGCDCLTDFESDLNNCGGCGLICLTRANSTATCKFGRCDTACKVGFADCNGIPTDGCETDTMKDPRNCGACGVGCATGQACIDGLCATEPCPPGVTR